MQTKTKSIGYFSIFAVITIVSLTVLLTLSALLPTSFTEAAGVNEKMIFDDGFESGDTDNWTSNVSWDVVGDDASQKQFKARAMGGDDTASVDTLTKKISTAGFENIRLSFDYKTTNLEPDDTVRLQVFSDGRWRTVKTYTDGRESLSWKHTSVSISTSDRSDFAFRFVADLDSEEDEFSLDAVELIGTPVEDEKESNIQSITAHIYRDHSSVEVDYDDTSRWLRFNVTNQDQVIEETALALGLTESQVFSLITFE